MLKQNVLETISQRYLNGEKPSRIAAALGLSINTVKSHVRRHFSMKTVYCKECGVSVPQNAGRKQKKFCSDKCRIAWWNRKYRHGGRNENCINTSSKYAQ